MSGKSNSKGGSKQFKKEHSRVDSSSKPQAFICLKNRKNTVDWQLADDSLKVYLTSKFELPAKEVEDGKELSYEEILMELMDQHPELTPRKLNDEGLTEDDIAMISVTSEEESSQKKKIKSKPSDALKDKLAAANKLFNSRVPTMNAIATKAREKRMEKYLELPKKRREAGLFILGEWMPYSCRMQVEAHPEFRSLDRPDASSPYEIRMIVKELFTDRMPFASTVTVKKEEMQLYSLKMNGRDYYTFLRNFRERVRIVRQLGGELDDKILIHYFTEGLSDDVFKFLKDDYLRPARQAEIDDGSMTFEEYSGQVEDFFAQWSQRQHRATGDSVKVFAADAVTKGKKGKIELKDGHDDTPATTGTSCSGSDGKPVCYYCGGRHTRCWNKEAMRKKLEEDIKAGEEHKAKTESKKKKKESETKNVSYFDLRDDVYVPQLNDLYDESSETVNVSTTSVHTADDCIDFVLDNCADIGLVSEQELGVHPRPANIRLEGVVPGASIVAQTKVSYRKDLGAALPVGDRNIVSDWELSKHYTLHVDDDDKHHLVFTHDATGDVLHFYRNPDRFGDFKFHMLVPRTVYMNGSFHFPKTQVQRDYSKKEQELMQAAEFAHIVLGHPDDAVLPKMAELHPALGFTTEGLKLLRELGPCAGCVQGKLAAQNKKAERSPTDTPKESYEIGEAAAMDIMFLDKGATLVVTDIASSYIVATDVAGRTLGHLKASLDQALRGWDFNRATLRLIKSDRERAIVSAASYIERDLNLKLRFTAAGQHQPLAENSIKLIKYKVRSTRSSIFNAYGYIFPDIKRLRNDAVRCINITPKRGQSLSPMEMFLRRYIDPKRDLRVALGEIILVHRPKATVGHGAEPNADWACVVGRPMDGTGVIEVLLIFTRRLAYRLKFVRTSVPSVVLSELRVLAKAMAGVTSEELTSADILELYEGIPLDDPFQAVPPPLSPAPEVPVLLPAPPDAPIPDSDPIPFAPPPAVNAPDASSSDTDSVSSAPDAAALEGDTPDVHDHDLDVHDSPPSLPDPSPLHENSESRYSLRARTKVDYKALHAGKDIFLLNTTFCEPGISDSPEFYGVFAASKKKVTKFAKALQSENREKAMESMLKEVKQLLDFESLHPVRLEDLSAEEQSRIVKNTDLYKEKYTPDGEFDKAKSRVIWRGDMQRPQFTAETSSPVARLESLMWILVIGLYCRYCFAKIDVVGAYLHTPRPPEVSYKHMWLSKQIADVFIKLRPEWEKFRRADGRMLVELDKLIYGYKEAAFYWYKYFTEILTRHGYTKSTWDPCVLFKHSAEGSILVGIVVDDCQVAASSAALIDEFVAMCNSELRGITVERGTTLSFLGMNYDLSVPGECRVTQCKYAQDLHQMVPEAKLVDHPYSSDFSAVPPEDDPPCDRNRFRSVTMMCAYGANRTTPQIKFGIGVLATVLMTATLTHWSRLLRICGYIIKNAKRGMLIKPGSLHIVMSSDASHLTHRDCRGHTGGALGVKGNGESISPCFFIFVSQKHHLVAKSSMEDEMIAADTNVDWVIWSTGLRNELLRTEQIEEFKLQPTDVLLRAPSDLQVAFTAAELEGDNLSAWTTLRKGFGSFKHTKHIDRRYFFVHGLVQTGQITLKWVQSSELVADLLTKAVTPETFKSLLEKLIGAPPQSQR